MSADTGRLQLENLAVFVNQKALSANLKFETARSLRLKERHTGSVLAEFVGHVQTGLAQAFETRPTY